MFTHIPNPVEEEAKRIKIFLPHLKVYPATLISLIGYKPVLCETLGEYGYHEYFQDRWREGETFITIEQDIIVYPGAVKALWDCPEPWCVYDFHLPCHWDRNLENEKVGLPLGCMKISKEIIEGSKAHWYVPSIHYGVVDLHLTKLTEKFKVHQHFPGVVNANEDLMPLCQQH